MIVGRGKFSQIKVLRHGLQVQQLAESKFPGKPSGLFILKSLEPGQNFHRYILATFSNATLVLEITDKINEVKDSGFLTNKSTILACDAK